MSVTDTYLCNDVVYKMLENGAADANFILPTALMTPMFTKQEIVDSMNRVQQSFMLETGMTVTRIGIAGTVGMPRYGLPSNSIRPRRITWTDASDKLTRCLTQADTWELDNGMSTWPTDRGIPIVWYENQLPQQQIGLAKTPSNNGSIGVLYVALAATLTGLGITLSVPDDWTPYILYGTLAELLSSDGDSFDPIRAQYCSQRFSEGVELARLVLGG